MNKRLMTLAFASALAALAVPASAHELYTGVGTTGVTFGYGHELTEHTAARVEGNVLDYSKGFSTTDANYDAKVKFTSLNAYYDYYPFSQGGLRLTVGVSVGDSKITGQARPSNGTLNINGVDYNAAGESITVSAKMPTVRPYLGIGVGHNSTDKGLGFFADIGVLVGRPKVDLTASQGLTNAAGQSNINAEKNKVQDEVNKFQIYPVVMAGMRYSFY